MLLELPQLTGGLENRDLLCHHSSLNTYPARRLAAAGKVSDECLRQKLIRNSTGCHLRQATFVDSRSALNRRFNYPAMDICSLSSFVKHRP
jgi:hypothetical protein